jgi:hypothetical protein
MTRWFVVLGLFLAGASGCGAPVNAAGSYSVSLTNKDNGCNIANWTVGQMATNIPITITQQDANVTAVVGGLAGAALTLGVGSATFTGTVSGPNLKLQLFGTRANTMNGCTYTLNASINATLGGDLLEGSIDYTPATNGSPNCGTLSMCTSTQDFNGTRPPM